MKVKCKVNDMYECREHLIKIRGEEKARCMCLTCPIFVESQQAIFNNIGEVKNLDLEKDLAQKAKEQPEFLSVTDLPDTMKLLLNDYKFKTDARGNEALFLYLRTKDNKMIVQKYTATSYDDILTSIKQAGGAEHLKITLSLWEKRMVGKMQKPRLVPVAEKKVKENV